MVVDTELAEGARRGAPSKESFGPAADDRRDLPIEGRGSKM